MKIKRLEDINESGSELFRRDLKSYLDELNRWLDDNELYILVKIEWSDRKSCRYLALREDWLDYEDKKINGDELLAKSLKFDDEN